MSDIPIEDEEPVDDNEPWPDQDHRGGDEPTGTHDDEPDVEEQPHPE